MSENQPTQKDRYIPHQWVASNLGEVFEIINTISVLEQESIPQSNQRSGNLWFRGHADISYLLMPGIHREHTTVFTDSSSPFYLQSNLRESMRRQHIQARIFHLLEENPGNDINWQEVGQHHTSKTRYLDWSESAIVSLKFALMDFLDSEKTGSPRKVPCLWVLNPRKLNYNVYTFFAQASSRKEVDLILRAVDEFPPSIDKPVLSDQIQAHLQNPQRYLSPYANAVGQYYYPKSDYELDGIPCLSVLDEMRMSIHASLANLLNSGAFNPYHYLLLRYYADAITYFVSYENKASILPPLAVLQPYHSSRIKAQRGVFTIFPNYISRDPWKENKPLSYTAMERQALCKDALFCIRLRDPNRIARELLAGGERISGLYPEITQYTSQLER